MKRKSILASAAVAAALVAAVGTMAASHDDDHGGSRSRRLKADLKGFGEVPAVSTPARGSFRAVLSQDESAIEYRLDYSDLQGTVLQSHIHVGAHHTNGGISVWLCGNPSTTPPIITPPAGTPTCGAPGATDRKPGAPSPPQRRRPSRAADRARGVRRAGPGHQVRRHLRQRPYHAGPGRRDPGPDQGRLSGFSHEGRGAFPRPRRLPPMLPGEDGASVHVPAGCRHPGDGRGGVRAPRGKKPTASAAAARRDRKAEEGAAHRTGGGAIGLHAARLPSMAHWKRRLSITRAPEPSGRTTHTGRLSAGFSA